MTKIAAKPGYTPPTPPRTYDAEWIRRQLSQVAQAVMNPSGRTVTFSSSTADKTVRTTDNFGVILCDATGGAFAVTLLPVAQCQFFHVTIKRINAGGNAVTITGTVDATVNPTLAAQWSSLTIWGDGSAYYKMASV